MKKTTVILSIVFGIIIIAGLVELVDPAPKMRDLCQQAPCPAVARDVFVGKYQDYRGQLVPYFLLGCLAFGILFVASSFFFSRSRWLPLIGFSIFSATIFYGILLRFILPFSIWPTPTWVVIGFVIIGMYWLQRLRTKNKFISDEKCMSQKVARDIVLGFIVVLAVNLVWALVLSPVITTHHWAGGAMVWATMMLDAAALVFFLARRRPWIALGGAVPFLFFVLPYILLIIK